MTEQAQIEYQDKKVTQPHNPEKSVFEVIKSALFQKGPNPQTNDLIVYFFCGPHNPPTPYF